MAGERQCRRRHDFEPIPFDEFSGFRVSPDGEREEGTWLHFRCRRCGTTAQQWHRAGDRIPPRPPGAGGPVELVGDSHDGEDGIFSAMANAPARAVLIGALALAAILVMLAGAYFEGVWHPMANTAAPAAPAQDQPSGDRSTH